MLFRKYEDIKLCEGLTLKEFQCKCKNDVCKSVLVDRNLVDAYDKFRCLVNTPLIISSGHRCLLHNKDVGGADLSRHLSGEAIDISLQTLREFDKKELKRLLKLAGFTWVKFYMFFIHADVREK